MDDDLPRYSGVPLAQTLFFSKPEKIGDKVTLNVAATMESDFFTTYFLIEHLISEKQRMFRVLPNGLNINPDVVNDFYYSFTLSARQKPMSGFFYCIGGRGIFQTPCQVAPYSSFIEFGIHQNRVSYTAFLNPFRSGFNMRKKKAIFSDHGQVSGTITKYEWAVQTPKDKQDATFMLMKWDEGINAGRKRNLNKNVVAEYRVTPNGSILHPCTDDPLWNSVEECAYIVGTAYCALLASESK
ncbi:hypothetical protein HDU84_009282 [Entophlyctis sp. JEL0112]|nr:hypothetical protein HDU84_009282 [Entophlyctis sp. JEL0112]